LINDSVTVIGSLLLNKQCKLSGYCILLQYISLLLALLALTNADPTMYCNNMQYPDNLHCLFSNKLPITVTESLINGLSEYQVDLTGVYSFGPGVGQVNVAPYHPTGFTIETVWNPFALGTIPPNAFPPYNNTIGQDFGSCISMTNGNACGQWQCTLNLNFYSSVAGVCMPPDGTCHNVDNGLIIGSVAFQGLFGSCANNNYNFLLPITGGTGIFAGAQGWINGTQPASYAYFTYMMHFT